MSSSCVVGSSVFVPTEHANVAFSACDLPITQYASAPAHKSATAPFYDWMPFAAPHWLQAKPMSRTKCRTQAPKQPVVVVNDNFEYCNVLCREYDLCRTEQVKKASGEKMRSVEKDVAARCRENIQQKAETKRLEAEARRSAQIELMNMPSMARGTMMRHEGHDEYVSERNTPIGTRSKRLQTIRRVKDRLRGAGVLAALRKVGLKQTAAGRMERVSLAARNKQRQTRWLQRQMRFLRDFDAFPPRLRKVYENLWGVAAAKCCSCDAALSELAADTLDWRIVPVWMECAVLRGILGAAGIKARNADENCVIRGMLDDLARGKYAGVAAVEPLPDDAQKDTKRFPCTLAQFAISICPEVRRRFIDANSTSQYLVFAKHADEISAILKYEQAKVVVYEVATGCKVPPSGLDDKVVTAVFKEKERAHMVRLPDGTLGVNFPAFQTLIQEVREVQLRTKHELEHEVATKYHVPHHIASGSLIGQLADLFTVFEACTGPEKATWEELRACLWALGILPQTKRTRDNMCTQLIDSIGLETHPVGYTFLMYLDMVQLARDINLQADERNVGAAFKSFDVDNTNLDTSEVSNLLTLMGLAPKTQEDQNQMVMLLESTFEDRELERITALEYVSLYTRVRESFQSAEYQREEDLAASLGIPPADVRRYRDTFMDMELSVSGGIDILGLRTVMEFLHLYVSADALKSQFELLDKDRSGYLEFSEFLELIHMLGKREGVFSTAPAPLRTLDTFDSLQLWKTAEALNMEKSLVRNIPNQELVRHVTAALTNIGVDPEANFAKLFGVQTHDAFINIIHDVVVSGKPYVAKVSASGKNSPTFGVVQDPAAKPRRRSVQVRG